MCLDLAHLLKRSRNKTKTGWAEALNSLVLKHQNIRFWACMCCRLPTHSMPRSLSHWTQNKRCTIYYPGHQAVGFNLNYITGIVGLPVCILQLVRGPELHNHVMNPHIKVPNYVASPFSRESWLVKSLLIKHTQSTEIICGKSSFPKMHKKQCINLCIEWVYRREGKLQSMGQIEPLTSETASFIPDSSFCDGF